MQFLSREECEQWSTAHDYGVKDHLPLPERRGVVRATIRTPREDTPSRAVAAALQRALGDWEELLVWVAETWVYSHEVEGFAIESLRELAGETRPASELYGQRLITGDELALRRSLVAAVDCPWFAYFLPGRVERRTPLRWARTTWDHYVRVTSSEPGGVDEFAADARRLGFTPVISIRTEEGEWVECDPSP
jgi:hypothetical protein